MKATTRRAIRRTLAVLVILYLMGGLLLYLFQDQLLFHPRSLPLHHRFSFGQPFHEYNIPSGQDNISILYFPVRDKKGAVVFFHGNRNHSEYYKKYPELFTRHGYEVWMIDYPGFGKSTGKRSERILYEQALLLYEKAAASTDPDSLVIYGKSIGTGMASYVASRRKARALILETPYYSMKSLAADYAPFYPVEKLIRYHLPVHRHLESVRIPVTVFHGTADEVIPYSHSLRLKKAHPRTELVTITKGRHNDLYDHALFQQQMDSLLNQQ